MAYDELVAVRIRQMLARRKNITEKKMFGGVAFMAGGHMCVGVVKDHLCLRLGDEGTVAALQEPHTRPMDFTGKPMRSMVYVDPPGFESDDDLRGWINRAMAFVKTLPEK